MVQIFELIVGYPPFYCFTRKTDELIEEWVSMLGDLPAEWSRFLPPTEANSTFLRQMLKFHGHQGRILRPSGHIRYT